MSEPTVRPVVIYPFRHPDDKNGLRSLYEMLSTLQSDNRFKKPVTVVNNQTWYRSPDARKSADDLVAPVSDITPVWAVDTCAMWLSGLGSTFQEAEAQGTTNDVFWLIPGDFNYSTDEGRAALELLPKIPLSVLEKRSEICLGEIEVPLSSAKQLIDTYGTYGLLYNWFPAEAQGIRDRTDKPRTEFFAVNYETLRGALVDQRWYAYEQTLMILLQNMDGKRPVRRIDRVPLGLITDDASTRSTLAAAMAQVERTERALKLFWREYAERHEFTNWHDDFRVLDAQSESVRTSAMVILRRLLK